MKKMSGHLGGDFFDSHCTLVPNYTFYWTRYLSHCSVLFCTKTFFL